ncbi:unnamed protein product, partial [Rotaria sp. Silwood2]
MHQTTNTIHKKNAISLQVRTIDSESDLYKACRDGDEDLVRGLLASLQYTDINCLEPNGSTALHAAASFGYPNIVRLLHDLHVDRRHRNVHGMTAYQEAKTDEIRQLFHRPNDTNFRFWDVHSSPL